MHRNGMMLAGILLILLFLIVPWLTALSLLLSYFGVPSFILAAGILFVIPMLIVGVVFSVKLVVDWIDSDENG